MIRPIDAYPGKVAPVSSEYPDGKAQNITSPGDGTGTPWEAKLVNDLFGFQQFITSKAGITPSGTPDNATASQQFDAMWKLLNVRSAVHNITADANYTLTTGQNLYAKLEITDTGVVLSAGRDIIIDDVGRILIFTNSTLQTLTVKVSGGSGVAVLAGGSAVLVSDGTDVTNFNDFAGSSGREVATAAEIRTGTNNEKVITPLGINSTILGMGQTYQDVTGSRVLNVTYTNTTGKPIWVSLYGTSAAATNNISVEIDGVPNCSRTTSPASYSNSVQAIIPNGSTYKATVVNSSVTIWIELR